MITQATATCLDSDQGAHSWNPTGLDVQDDKLVHTARCDWCAKTAAKRVVSHSSVPFRAGVRKRA